MPLTFNEQGALLIEDVGGKTFIGLTDTPAAYAGNANRVLFVNATPDGVDFASNCYWDDVNDRLGVGTSTPTLSGAGTGIDVYDSGTLAEYKLHNSVSGTGALDGFNMTLISLNAVINNRENGYLGFYTNNTERMRILATGYVGIGATAPGSLMEWNFADDDIEFVDAHAATGVGSISGVIEVQRGGATEYIALYDSYS